MQRIILRIDCPLLKSGIQLGCVDLCSHRAKCLPGRSLYISRKRSHLNAFHICRCLYSADIVGQLAESVLPEGKADNPYALEHLIDRICSGTGGSLTCSLQILEQERQLEDTDFRNQAGEICRTGDTDIYGSLLKSLHHGRCIAQCRIIEGLRLQCSVGICVDICCHSLQARAGGRVLRDGACKQGKRTAVAGYFDVGSSDFRISSRLCILFCRRLCLIAVAAGCGSVIARACSACRCGGCHDHGKTKCNKFLFHNFLSPLYVFIFLFCYLAIMGKNVVMAGIMISMTVPMAIVRSGIGRCGMILWTGCPPTLDATYRLIPTGGVASPIQRVTTIITPKYTRLIL